LFRSSAPSGDGSAPGTSAHSESPSLPGRQRPAAVTIAWLKKSGVAAVGSESRYLSTYIDRRPGVGSPSRGLCHPSPIWIVLYPGDYQRGARLLHGAKGSCIGYFQTRKKSHPEAPSRSYRAFLPCVAIPASRGGQHDIDGLAGDHVVQLSRCDQNLVKVEAGADGGGGLVASPAKARCSRWPGIAGRFRWRLSPGRQKSRPARSGQG